MSDLEKSRDTLNSQKSPMFPSADSDTVQTGYNVGVAQQQIYVTHNVRLYPELDVAVVM